tara:strand:+ start:76195 stop:76401 length:207 start_codon:yes stop_codon:yes gene_type:complete
MATINNTNDTGGGSSVGIIAGIIVVLLLIGLFFVYALPALRGSNAPEATTIDLNVDVPANNEGAAPAP